MSARKKGPFKFYTKGYGATTHKGFVVKLTGGEELPQEYLTVTGAPTIGGSPNMTVLADSSGRPVLYTKAESAVAMADKINGVGKKKK